MAITTTADIIRNNNAEPLAAIVDDCCNEVPEFNYFSASGITKNTFKTLTVTSLPSVSFVDADENRTFDSETTELLEVTCKRFDGSWSLRKALANMADYGPAIEIAKTQKAHLKAALLHCAKQIWYGTNSDIKGFQGLGTFLNSIVDTNNNKTRVLTVNSLASVTDGSSVFFTCTGDESLQLTWGNEGKITEGEIREQWLGTSSSGGLFYMQELAGWIGLKTSSHNCAVRIIGLSDTTGNVGLDDDLIYKALGKFPAGIKPTGIWMTRRSLEQLRKSRTATNITGAPAPTPTVAGDNIPIYTTDAISDSENYSSGEGSGSGSGSSGSGSGGSGSGGSGSGT